MFIPLANEVHFVIDLAKIGGSLVGAGALIGAGCGLFAPDGEKGEAVRNGFVIGAIIGLVFGLSGAY